MRCRMKRLVILTAILALLSVGEGYCQSISQARAYAGAIEQAHNSGMNNQKYAAVYNCYLECLSIVENRTPDSADYNEAKELLKHIWSHLFNGVVFYQKTSDKNTAEYARAFVDIPLMDIFAKEREMMLNTSAGGGKTIRDNFPIVINLAASRSYNIKDFYNAIKYSKLYLDTVNPKDQFILQCLYLSQKEIGHYNDALRTLDKAIAYYPTEIIFYNNAISVCMESGEYGALESYLTRARELRPNDVGILSNLGKLYEDNRDYAKAYNIYLKLNALRPNNLGVAKHLARNCYNLGTVYLNRSSATQNKQEAEQYMNTALDYFRNALPTFNSIVISDPENLEFLESLAAIYHTLGDEKNLAATNDKIRTLGGIELIGDGATPAIMASEGLEKEREQSALAKSRVDTGDVVENFSEYAQKYVGERYNQWAAKDPYETTDDYLKRCSKENQVAKQKELLAQAERNYIAVYANSAKLRDMKLHPYDADSGTFYIESEYGGIVVPVPRTNNEAQIFEKSWLGVKFRNPVYKVVDNKIVLAQLTFETPNGKHYTFDDKKKLAYTQTNVEVTFSDIDLDKYAKAGTNQPKIEHKTINLGASDVDQDIPRTTTVNDNTYAIVIANENYTQVAPVPMAINDGNTFSQYCELTLGLPKNNITFIKDATFGIMVGIIAEVKALAAAHPNPASMNIIFYYSGHGVPNESTKDGFLVPTDASGRITDVCYPLSKLYSELGNLGAGNVTLFIDACFSGGQRDGGTMFADARAINLKAKAAAPVGNMVVFSAASGDETALPYKEKSHGMFTYFLLKKIKESRGEVTLGELASYIHDNVRFNSVKLNRKEQNPTTTASMRMSEIWRTLKLNNKKR